MSETHASHPEPAPLYQAKPGMPLYVDRAVYGPLADRTELRTLRERFIVPKRSGYAWKARAGDICRVSLPEGPQVADLDLWNLHDPRERFWSGRTKQLHSAHMTRFDRFWSCLPFLRPMATVLDESVRYGIDADGAGCHDLLGTRCDPYVHELLNGESFDLCCHSNLTRAVLPFGLTEYDIHDNLNMFQVTGLTREGRYFAKPSPAKKGDYFEFIAEIDLLCAISACPHGDLSVPMWGPNAGDPAMTCRPLAIEIYEVAPQLLAGWSPAQAAQYAGLHGLDFPERAAQRNAFSKAARASQSRART
jgi:uncharacterized protein YcgI (DUF1989 family)